MNSSRRRVKSGAGLVPQAENRQTVPGCRRDAGCISAHGGPYANTPIDISVKLPSGAIYG